MLNNKIYVDENALFLVLQALCGPDRLIKKMLDTINDPVKEGEDKNPINILIDNWQVKQNLVKQDQYRFQTESASLNHELGGGFKTDDQWFLGGFSYQEKRDLGLTLCKHFMTHNTPVVKNLSKKPLILHISNTDTVPVQVSFIYNLLKEEGKLKNVHHDGSDVINRVLEKTGWEVKFIHAQTGFSSSFDFQRFFDQLEKDGFDPQICIFNDLLPIKTREQEKEIFDYLYRKNILFLTHHRAPSPDKLIQYQRNITIHD